MNEDCSKTIVAHCSLFSLCGFQEDVHTSCRAHFHSCHLRLAEAFCFGTVCSSHSFVWPQLRSCPCVRHNYNTGSQYRRPTHSHREEPPQESPSKSHDRLHSFSQTPHAYVRVLRIVSWVVWVVLYTTLTQMFWVKVKRVVVSDFIQWFNLKASLLSRKTMICVCLRFYFCYVTTICFISDLNV